MQPETEQLLSDLHRLTDGVRLRLPNHEDGGKLAPFVWDGSQQGAFSPLDLLRFEGWLTSTDLNAALTNWQLPEQTGAVHGESWLLPSNDAAKILLDAATRTTRAQHYQNLVSLLQTHLKDLQVFELSCRNPSDGNSNPYRLVVLVGKDGEGNWIGLGPTVPHATAKLPFCTNSLPSPGDLQPVSNLTPELQAILSQLPPIQIYGYYGGGYDQTHSYQLVHSIGITQAATLEILLGQVGLLEVGSFTGFAIPSPSSPRHLEQGQKLEQLNQVLQQFPQLQVYRFCFWNQEQVYILGKSLNKSLGEPASDTDRVGVVLRSQFTYNP